METSNGKEKWFETRVGFMISVATVLIGCTLAIFVPMWSMQRDIAVINAQISNINTNHETHIQDALQAIQELKEDQGEQQLEITELLKQITETQTLIKVHMGIK